MGVVGDFNLGAEHVETLLSENDFPMDRCLDGTKPTNLWRFTNEGKQYDSAFLSSYGADVNATGDVLEIDEIKAAYSEMQNVAVALKRQPPSRVARRALGGLSVKKPRSLDETTDSDTEEEPDETTTATDAATDDADDMTVSAGDDVPSWLRNRYRVVLSKIWSDHLPIKVELV